MKNYSDLSKTVRKMIQLPFDALGVISSGPPNILMFPRNARDVSALSAGGWPIAITWKIRSSYQPLICTH